MKEQMVTLPQRESQEKNTWKNNTNMKRYHFRVTEAQSKILEAKSKAAGFCHKSEYVRFLLFMEINVVEKIDAIYQKLIKNG